MSRWQHGANDSPSPSDSISHLPGVGCAPHNPRAFPCTCASCHVVWRCAVHAWSHAARSSHMPRVQVGSRYTARLRQQGITSIGQFSEMAASPAGRAALFSLCKGDRLQDRVLQLTTFVYHVQLWDTFTWVQGNVQRALASSLKPGRDSLWSHVTRC